MVIHLPKLVTLMLFLLSLAVAETGCRRSCGGVSIPFPFGMESPDCYLNSWYAVDCFSENPFLSFSNHSLEVLSISEENSTMIVKQPASTPFCSKNFNNSYQEWSGVNLSGSPFFYSEKENVLSGFGCNNFARIHTYGTVAGCYSSCADENVTTVSRSGCFGTECCQTLIPTPLQTFYTSALMISSKGKEDCRRTILVQDKWLTDGNISTLKNSAADKMEVPVVLGWGIIDNFENSNCSYFSSFKNVTVPSVAFRNYTVPKSLVRQYFCKRGYEGNAYLRLGCEDIDECQQKNKCPHGMQCENLRGGYTCHERRAVSILGISMGLVSFLLLLIGGGWRGYILFNKRKDKKLKEKYFKRNGGLLLQQQLTSFDGDVDRSKMFNSKEIDKATDHFNVNRILGQGGQGTVYKGMLTDGRIVAIKKSKVIDEGKIEEFINEVAILSHISHRNVVRLLGCCLETEVPLLVYEFIPNGTLFQYLHHQSDEFSLTWEMRLRIASEVAGALFYLHSAAAFPIYHRDIKSSNILLDDKYRAKVADFGTSKSLSIDQTHVTTKVLGTVGYVDPEYFQSNQFTDKSDVYSFGVVLVELLTGQAPISLERSQENRNLVVHFIISMEENKLLEILDPEVMKGDKEEVVATAELAKRCLNLNGKKRPTMRELAGLLEGIRTSQNQTINVATSSKIEEVEYVRTEVIEPWDVVSNSTGSTFEITISSGVEPLLN